MNTSRYIKYCSVVELAAAVDFVFYLPGTQVYVAHSVHV